MTRTANQDKLLTDPAAWGWYMLGYERGVQAGHDLGAQSVVDDLKQAGGAVVELLHEAEDHQAALAARREADGRPDTRRGEW